MKKLFNPIAIYNYNNNKYFIALDGNQVAYFKYENNEISNAYSSEEIEVFMEVYNSLKVSKEEAINLGIRRIGKKLFDFYYDLKKELYFWYRIIDGRKCELQKEELEFMNYKYNHQSLKLYDEQEPDIYDWDNDQGFLNAGEEAERRKTLQRSIIHKGKMITIILMAGISLVSLSDSVLHSNISDSVKSSYTDKSDRAQYGDVSNEEYSFDIVQTAIIRNEEIGDAEKMFFLKFKPYFDENHDYMDMNLLLKRLSSLKIVYKEEECALAGISGEYKIANNTITLYGTKDFESCDKTALAHELFHVSQRGYSKRLTMELSNELTLREYLRGLVEDGEFKAEDFKNEYDVPMYGDGYGNCIKVYYLMANLFDRETLRKYQCIPADSILVNALMEIDKQGESTIISNFEKCDMEARAIELLDAIDEFRSDAEIDGYRDIEYTDKKYKHICELLNHYYEIKIGKKIEECFVEDAMSFDYSEGRIDGTTSKGKAINEVMLVELQKAVKNLDEGYKVPMGDFRYVLPRTYYSERHKNPIIYVNTYEKTGSFSARGLFIDVELTPEINEAYNKAYVKYEQERIHTPTETNNPEVDQLSGMGSIEIDRDD